MSDAIIDLDDRVSLPLYVLGIILVVGAAYRTGRTGDTVLLAVAVSGLGALLALTFDEE